MLDFTSSLYLGLQHPSRSLAPWGRLTTGVPAVMGEPPESHQVARGLARLQGVERTVLYPDHLVVDCVGPQGPVELAMSRESLTGFQAWLEARPPGTDWSR